MKYLDEFRDPSLARALLGRLNSAAGRLDRPVRVMEICGGHTAALLRTGIHSVLPERVRIISGPGCPVCVTASTVIDAAIWLCGRPGVHVFTFGDMVRVPGSHTSLANSAREDSLHIIYSALQAVEFAQQHPDATCVLLGVGFETTAPTLATAVTAAAAAGMGNFFFLAAGKLTPPAMRALLQDEEQVIDGFIAPGHVTTIIGAHAYRFIGEEFKRPCVVSGFELCDLLESLAMVIEQIADGRCDTEIQYGRSVTFEGNRKAQAVIARVFDVAGDVWRGLGMIPLSGYKLRSEFAGLDALGRLDVPAFEPHEPHGCKCGDVLRGVCMPQDCGLFGIGCTPEHPIGPCMVSSEGSCAAYYRYGRH
ncbi:hydrogenase formation protein HypD [bacterium]|nr:hydrogenase formation protein HypD [bacterium]